MTIQLTPLQHDHLRTLTATLSRDQALWVSGYLAGVAEARLPEAPMTEAPMTAPAPELSVETTPVAILYGSETGNARGLAERIGEIMTGKGLAARVLDMEDYKTNHLRDEKYLVLVTATHGEGDPPDPARSFYEFLMGRKAPRLDGVRFAVLGLGDSSYEHFCQTAKDFDARLEALGAERVRDRLDCDVDYETPAASWIEAAVAALEKVVDRAPDRTPDVVVPLPAAGQAPVPDQPEFHAAHPFPAAVYERLVLNGRGSDKTTYHLELGLDGSGLSYAPGDSLGVVVENDPVMVEEILTALGLDGADGLDADLRRTYELTVLTPKFIAAYGEAADARPLRDLTQDRDALRRYMEGRQIVDVIRDHPAKGIAAEDFTALLRKLQPRLYSLASSQSAYPDEAHITVAEVRFQSPFAPRFGVASGHLGHRLDPAEGTVPVYIERNDRFRLPQDPATPIIMIGAGTGIAPYRAFLQERAEHGASGKSWLFFGDRRFRTDFLYQTEWQQFLKEKALTRMDVAFSRDQADKIYVQDRMRDQGRDLYAWLEDGAHLYVCGDAKKMAPDVHATLIDIVAHESGRDEDAARDYVSALTADKRYKRDVY